MTAVVHLDENGTPADVNSCLNRLGYNHSENHISSDHNVGWYITTEISSHRNAEPARIIRELKTGPHVVDAEIR